MVMNYKNLRQGLASTAVIVALIAAVTMIVVALAAVFTYRHPVFPWDMWDTVEMYRDFRDGRGSWASLWALHNEHRILFPRLLILWDYTLVAASGSVLLALILMLHAAHAGLLVRAFAQRGSGARQVTLYACLVLMAFFWLKQRENFIWPFQIAWILNAFFASLAAWCAARDPAPRGLFAAALCCVVAAFSLASGIFMPFVIAVVLWRVGVPPRRLAVWSAFAMLLAAVYLAGYAPEERIEGQRAFAPLRTLLYAAALLGNPVLLAGVPQACAMLLGSAGMLWFGVLAFGFSRGRDTGPASRFAFSVAGYALVIALLTGWGRQASGFEGAASNRYVTTSLIFWMTLLGWQVTRADIQTRKRILGGALAVFLVYFVPTQILLIERMREKFQAYDEASLAMLAGVDDSLPLYELSPDAAAMWRRREILREDGLSVYREPWARMVGTKVAGLPSALFPCATCTVTLDEVRRIEKTPRSGYFVRGRLAGFPEGGLPEVLLLTRGDTVAGAVSTVHRGCPRCFSGYVGGDGRDFGIRPWSEDAAPGPLVPNR